MTRHIPQGLGEDHPEEAIAVRERGSATALRQMIWELADSRALVRGGRPRHPSGQRADRELYAGLRALAVPEEPTVTLWRATTLLREHRGDGHNAALLAHGIGGTEAHVLMALSPSA